MTEGKDVKMLLQEPEGLLEQQNSYCIFPHYSKQPSPGQCTSSHHSYAQKRGPCGTDCAPRRWSLCSPEYQNSCTHFHSFDPVQRCSTHQAHLRTHNTSRSYCPSSALAVAFCGTHPSLPTEQGFSPFHPDKTTVQEQPMLTLCPV